MIISLDANELQDVFESVANLGKSLAASSESAASAALFPVAILEIEALVLWRKQMTERAANQWGLIKGQGDFSPYSSPPTPTLYPTAKIECFLRAGRGQDVGEILAEAAPFVSEMLKVQAWRLTGQVESAMEGLRSMTDVLESRGISPSEAVDVPAWLIREGATLQAMLNHDLQPMINAVQEEPKSRSMQGLVHLALWARVEPSRRFIDLVMKAESIRRSLGSEFDRSKAHYATYTALRLIEQLEDSATPADQTIRAVGKLLDSCSELPDATDELLCLAAACRVCQTRALTGPRQTLLREYRQLSLSLSAGKTDDLLFSMGDLTSQVLQPSAQIISQQNIAPLQTLTQSTIMRIWRVGGVTAKWVGIQIGKKALKTLHLPITKLNEQETKVGEQVIRTLGTLKGPLMKLGQIAGYFADVCPEFPILAQFATLQKDSRRVKTEVIYDAIRRELGDSPENIFASFDKEPIAAASIGQVHRATMKDGREVVVKVQFPFVEKAIRADLSVMRLAASILKVRLPKLKIDAVIDVILDSLLQECDYGQEANAQEFFRNFFEGHPVIRIPAVVRELSTRRVLVMDYAPGETVRDFISHSTQAERNDVGLSIFEFMFRTLYGTGWFYSDPHGGNYKVHEGKVWFLDFGCVSRFEEGTIQGLKSYARSFLRPDAETNWVPSAEIWRAFSTMPPLGAADGFDDAANHQMMCETFILPWRLNRPFAFTPEFVKEETRRLTMGNKNAKHLQMPPTYVLFLRLAWGLHTVLATLQAENLWQPLMRDILNGPLDTTATARFDKGREPAPNQIDSAS